MAYIDEPFRIPFVLRFGIWLAEKKLGKKLLAARILSWYPKAALGAGVLESLVAHREGKVTKRLLKLIRMQVSFMASCPFCIDLNSKEFSKEQVTEKEIEALQGKHALEYVETFAEEEVEALRFTRSLTSTPIRIQEENVAAMKRMFSEREFVVIASTIAQVNFWTRLIQGLGVPPAGFSENCRILRLDDYQTLSKQT